MPLFFISSTHMKILFLGTRGNIKTSNLLHKRHTTTLISYKKTRVAIDCGLDWLNAINIINPDAFLITHAHPDHIGGLKHGSPFPVYATTENWEHMSTFPIDQKHIVIPRKQFTIDSLLIEAFVVEHALNTLAVGYRITGGNTTLFCVHDLLSIKNRTKALENVSLYIGDGATFIRPIMRYRNNMPMGHTTIKEQLTWCKKAGIPRAIFTHCGSHIVKDTTNTVEKNIIHYGLEQGIETNIAYDGMKITI